jgi:hypothetical protein
MTERRYDDEEVAAIFREAAAEGPDTPRALPARSEGLTLADLQVIGREVGLSADAVARAALTLEVRRGASQRSFLGLPIGVARTVDLHRQLTDAEWERLVVQLREVFQARGRMRAEGSLREWSNGNLHVLLEPTETGHRLRFGTTHGAARASIGMGLMTLGVTAAMTVATALSGELSGAVAGIAFMGTAGLGMIANGALRLPRWARLRARQMEKLAVRLALPPGGSTDPSPTSPAT